MAPISVQLYSLRALSEGDFPGVLRAVAETGFKGVEFAGLYNHDPKEIAKILSDLGIQTSSSHTEMPTKENVAALTERELTLGNKHVISGGGLEDFNTPDKCKKMADLFQTAADLLKPYGMSFGFHNHWMEFEKLGDKFGYDILLKEAPDVFSELDTYWTAFAGVDPVEIVKKYGTRLPFLHIKDGMLDHDEVGGNTHTAVGQGKMNVPGIINAANPNTLKWVVVEIDTCKTDMLQAVKDSYKYLTSNGLASGNK
jgi:sugar phosphate isomerase/epimerase